MNAAADNPEFRDDDSSVYNRTFWLAYVANLLLVCANTVTFRFAEFVHFLGGSEEQTGGIIRAGVVGSILIRLTLARDLDRLGVRRMWIGSSFLFLVGCGFLLQSTSVGWELYVARIAFAIGLAAMFACSNVHVQHRAPLHRRTELIASLGSSGFLGMILGAQVGDLLFESMPRDRTLFLCLFGLTTLFGVCYLGIVTFITREDEQIHQPDTPPPWTLLRRYWPGPVVLVALVVGAGFVLTTVFLTRQATELGLVGVRTYFTCYALSAFSFRVASRTWSRTMGRHRMILCGLAGHAVGFLLLQRISAEWHFVMPALSGGFGHALLFPCIVSLGSERFPASYRGSGTTLILGFIDVGGAICAQPMGWVIDHYGFSPLYLGAAGVCLTVLAIYGALMFHAPDADRDYARAVLAAASAPDSAANLTAAEAEQSPSLPPSIDPVANEPIAPAGALPR